MKVTFDPVKRAWTLEARQLDMARAGEVFDAPNITDIDDRFDYGEERLFTVGMLDGRMVVVVWTPRNGSRRIISLRKANGKEQAVYGARLGRP